MTDSEEDPVVFHAHCWRYDVTSGSVLAKDWHQHNVVSDIEVRRPASGVDKPYSCTIRDSKGGGWFLFVSCHHLEMNGVLMIVCIFFGMNNRVTTDV